MNEWLKIDLQLFAGEKTEKATPKRRQEARRKGQVFRSIDLNSAIIILAAFATLYFTFPYTLHSIKMFTVQYLEQQTLTDISPEMVYVMFLSAVEIMVKSALPIMVTAGLAGLITSLLQVGFLVNEEALQFKLERINPVEGFKRIFSKRALVELVKSIAKISLIGYVVYKVVTSHLIMLPLFIDMQVVQIVRLMLDLIFELAMKVGIALLVIGILDYLYQRWEYEQSLKMTKQEVKEEYKQMEGDPLFKSKQRQRQREMATKRMMAEVPKADVVITNPTHYAVALRYESGTMAAPMVVAKGQDFVALKIKEIAVQNRVTVVENPFLARTLYYVTEIGDLIPEDLYQAVAEVLAFVYRQKKKVL